MRREVEEFYDLFDTAAVRFFVAANGWGEQGLLPQARAAVPMPPDEQIAQDGCVLEQFDILEGARNPEFGDAEGRLTGDVLILEVEPPGRRIVEPGNQIEDRTLAGAVRSDDRENFTLLQREADGIDGLQSAEVKRKILGAEITHRLRSDFT